MKYSIATATALLASVAVAHGNHGAAHHRLHARDVITKTTVEMDTVYQTITVTPGQPLPSDDSSPVSAADAIPTTAAAPDSVAISSAVAQAAAPSAPAQAPPAQSASSAPLVPSVAAPAVTPSSAFTPPAAPSTPPAAPSASAPSSGSAGGGQQMSGDVTYYDASGYGRCGYELSNANNTVAVAVSYFGGKSNIGGQPAPGTPCNKLINMWPNGKSAPSVQLVVADGCGGCDEKSLDLPTNFFTKVMPGGESAAGVGRFSNIDWEWAS